MRKNRHFSDLGFGTFQAVNNGLKSEWKSENDVETRDVETVIFRPLLLPHLSLPLPLLPLLPTKNEKTTGDNFLTVWVCSLPSPTLDHFERTKPSFIAITLPTSLEHIVPNYSVFLFLRY